MVAPTKRTLVVAALILVPLISHVRAELVTSRLDVYADHEEIVTKSAAAGSVDDEKSLIGQAQSVSTQSATDGIGLTTLAQNPGSFVATDLLTTRAQASQSVAGPVTAGYGIGGFTRSGTFAFNAIALGLNGTDGTMRLTFHYYWAEQLQGLATASINLGVFSDSAGGDAFSRNFSGNGGLTSSSGEDFWTAIDLPFTFGVAFDLQFTLSSVASVSTGPGDYAELKGSLEIWDAQVFDQNGNPLVRFTDYDWIEFLGPQQTPYPVAAGAALPTRVPFVALERDTNGDLLVNFFGALEQSSDLVNWTPIDETLISPLRLASPLQGRQFFRSR